MHSIGDFVFFDECYVLTVCQHITLYNFSKSKNEKITVF